MSTRTETPETYYRIMTSPFGKLLLVGSDGALTGLYLAEHDRAPQVDPSWTPDEGRLDDVHQQLEQYFAGSRTEFELTTRPDGTKFQRAVWSALAEIPYGETVSYGDIAQRIGRPDASRAVGAANGQNPVSIVIPCHRVIGSTGELTGYGWGVDRKVWLLDHEQGRTQLPV